MALSYSKMCPTQQGGPRVDLKVDKIHVKSTQYLTIPHNEDEGYLESESLIGIVMKQYQKVVDVLLHIKSHPILNLQVKVEGIIHVSDVKMGLTSKCVHESLWCWTSATLFLNVCHARCHQL